MRLTNKICIISFFSLGLCFVVSEAILKQASYYSTKYLKYESFGIFEFCSHLAFLILWFLACFTIHLLETPFGFVIFDLNLLKIVS